MNETLKTLHALHSTHGHFSDREIAPDDLQTILQAAVRAANASNRQSYSIIAIADRDRMAQILQNQDYRGSHLLLFCVDFHRLFRLATHLDCQFRWGKQLDWMTGIVDAALVAQTACIAARSLGIDSLFTNNIFRGDLSRFETLLNLPHRFCWPVIALSLGYESAAEKHLKGRLPISDVVHHEQYKDYGADELNAMIKVYDDPQADLGLLQNFRQRGFEHYLQWFFARWNSLHGVDLAQLGRILEERFSLETSQSAAIKNPTEENFSVD